MIPFISVLFISISAASGAYLLFPVLIKRVRHLRRIAAEKTEKRADELYLALRPELFLPAFVMRALKKKRIRALDQALPAVIDRMVSAVRSGSSLKEAFERSGTSETGPFSEEARHACREMELGLSFEEALARMSKRLPQGDAGVFCTALIIAQRTGGGVSGILSTIAQSLREQRDLDGKVRVLTAQGRLQGLIIGLLPMALLVALYFLDPEMVKPLFTTSFGKALLAAGAVLEMMGLWMIRKMVDVRV